MKKIDLSILFVFILLISLLTFITGCNSEEHEMVKHGSSKINMIKNKKLNPPVSFYTGYQLPISTSSKGMNKGIGWLNNKEIIYMTEYPNGAELFRYDLFTGKSSFLFESKVPVISTIISADRKNILIQTSPSTYLGLITIINIDGEILYSKEFPSFEMAFEWNRYNKKQLLITAFQEDWRFSHFLLDVENKKLEEVDIRKPFGKWIGENKLAYLDWNENDISLLAPLVQKELDKGEVLLKDQIFYFDTFLSTLFTVYANPDLEEAKYSFYTSDMKELSTFNVPVLASYSGWVVPYYDFAADNQHFISLIPYESAEADTYQDGFQLISFDLKKHEKVTILSHTENVPITCSPNGQFCLMGYQFEKLLQLQNKSFISLFKS
ncbi:MAG TPA: hypothetical protein VEV44_04510 [Pseudoneobacillus sp.]|nr:hypothetical protein [Pseudoneobacillus sp.]